MDKKINNSNQKNDFWTNNPSILFQNNNYYKIFPTANMTNTEKLNALTRLFIILAILIILFSICSNYIYIPIIAIIIIVLYYMQNNNINSKEKFNNVVENEQLQCKMPTDNNPLMNITMADLMDDPERQQACMLDNKYIKSNDNIFKDPDDIFGKKYLQRQFYTMPTTTNPNDQTSFAKWLYQMPETCKENQLKCLRYEDLRFNRYNPDIDTPKKDQD